jgi:hypothetical protein
MRLPRSAQELSSLLGLVDPAEWFWAGVDSNKGSFSGGAGGVKDITKSGFVSNSDFLNIIDTDLPTFPNEITSDKALLSATSFCMIIFLHVSSPSGAPTNGVLKTKAPGFPYCQLYAYGTLDQYLHYCLTNEQQSGSASGNSFSKSGSVGVSFWGWDARIRKSWSVSNGALSLGSDSVSSNWALGSFFILKRFAYAFGVDLIGFYSGGDAENLKDNAVARNATLLSLLNANGKITSSSSRVFHRTSSEGYSVSNVNFPLANENGLIVTKAIQNLITDCNGMAGWTKSAVTTLEFAETGASGLRVLSNVNETAADAEHNATIAWTPLATGRHWFECTCRMSSVAGASLEITNGTDASYVSFDLAGAITDYVVKTDGAEVRTIGYRLYRIKLPLDVTVTDECSIILRCLALSGSTWVDSYIGLATRVMSFGEWSFCLGDECPLAVPISIGSAATAIATIEDWVDPIALLRMSSGLLRTTVRVEIEKWAKADYCLWTWRKDANNAIEVWVRYTGTQDGRQKYCLKINIITAGTATETALDTGDWVLDSDISVGYYVRDFKVSVRIDSAGLCQWWVRGEPLDTGIPIYETENKQVGEQTLDSFVAVVPTSLRLGCGADGTGQQNMTIKEILAW